MGTFLVTDIGSYSINPLTSIIFSGKNIFIISDFLGGYTMNKHLTKNYAALCLAIFSNITAEKAFSTIENNPEIIKNFYKDVSNVLYIKSQDL